MILFWECLIAVLLFTLIVVPMTLRNPLASLGDYPPAIRARCEELGLVEKKERRFSKAELVRKIIAVLACAALLAFVLLKINGDRTFLKGFLDAYLIWLVITWYDALVLDCGWFCHSKRVRIPGTENMRAYRDYAFHIRQSLIGTLLGLPACLVVGLLVAIFA